MIRVEAIKSFEGFVEDLHKLSPDAVVLQADVRHKPNLLFTPRSRTAGKIGNFQYGLHYAVTDSRRTRSYFEGLFLAHQTERGVLDEEDRKRRIIATMLAGETRVEFLRSELLGVSVTMVDAADQLMTAERFERLHQMAEEHDVSSALNHEALASLT